MRRDSRNATDAQAPDEPDAVTRESAPRSSQDLHRHTTRGAVTLSGGQGHGPARRGPGLSNLDRVAGGLRLEHFVVDLLKEVQSVRRNQHPACPQKFFLSRPPILSAFPNRVHAASAKFSFLFSAVAATAKIRMWKVRFRPLRVLRFERTGHLRFSALCAVFTPTGS